MRSRSTTLRSLQILINTVQKPEEDLRNISPTPRERKTATSEGTRDSSKSHGWTTLPYRFQTCPPVWPPKTRKEKLCRRPIISASSTYNYPLAKWLDERLKPLSANKYCINDIFGFIDEIKNSSIEPNHILVSYDVSAALFTNVPVKETIDRFHCHAIKKYIENYPVEKAEKLWCYRR